LLIHASKTVEDECAWWDVEECGGIMPPDENAIERGGIVGVVDLADVTTDSESVWFCGTLGFVLTNARPLPFFPCKGMLGLFQVDLGDGKRTGTDQNGRKAGA
jgi:hypothetical protein